MAETASVHLRRQQEATCERRIMRIAEGLALDERVWAVWLYGSLGRGDGDALSDLDVIIVMAPGRGEEMVAERLKIAAEVPGPQLGELALVLDSPHNAPIGGAQVNALYDSEPLPVYVDWCFWPPILERASNVRVLFEREGVAFTAGRTYEMIQAGFTRQQLLPATTASQDHFKLAMLPIVAKCAARGCPDDVRRMCGYLQEPEPASMELGCVIGSLRAIVERLRAGEPAVAVNCVLRYLDVLPLLVEP